MEKFRMILSNKTSRQTAYLFVAQILSLISGFVINMFLAKNMGLHQFGIYSFTIAVLNFCAIFFEFGYFASASKLLAEACSLKREQEIIGAILIIAVFISISYVFTIIFISYIIDGFFEDKIGYILRILSIISFSFILPFFTELIMKGSNQIFLLARFNVLWKFLNLFLVILLYYFNLLTPLLISFMFAGSCLVAFVICIFFIKPKFANLFVNLKILHEENKNYGIDIYWARIISVASYQIDKMLVSYFVGAQGVGLYTLAASISSPTNVFSTALASSKFKSLTGSKSIPKKMLFLNVLGILVSVISVLLGGKVITHFFLSIEYRESYNVLLILVLATAFQAAYQPYNAWLTCNGYSKLQKNMSFKLTIVGIMANILLTPFFGMYGAASACSIFMISAFLLHKKLYFKLS